MTRDEVVGKLERLGACGESLAWLRSQPEGATGEEMWGACEDPRWLVWLVEQFGLATLAYYEATAAARRAYLEATAPAGRAYREATAAARRAYDEASAAAGRAYSDATDAARRAYREACAPARRVYADAIRAAVPWSLVAAKLEER